MAATRLAQALVERDARRFSITIIGDEPRRAYNRIQLSPVLGAEKTAGATRLLPAEWYSQHNVMVRAGETVTAVDMAARTLQTTAGELGWDELVFATGSLPFLPPLPGITLPHVLLSAPRRTSKAFWPSTARRWSSAVAYSAWRPPRRYVVMVTVSLYCTAEAG